MYSGRVYGNKTNNNLHHTDWNWEEIVHGTKIGMLLEFSQDGTATVTAYKNRVWAGVLSTGSLRGPLCPSLWFFDDGGSAEFVSSKPPTTY